MFVSFETFVSKVLDENRSNQIEQFYGDSLPEKISELVWLYIKRRPYLKEALRSKIVNYSALARRLSLEILGRRKNIAAVKASLMRISLRLSESEGSLEERVLSVLKDSSITITTKVAVVISSLPLDKLKPLSFVKSRGHVTYIVPELALEELRKSPAIIKIERTLNLITIHSTEDIESVPGVIAMILNALASDGINVVEFISCYTDTILIVKESDTSRVYEILSAMMR